MDNLTNEEKVAFDTLAEVIMTLCDRAIENRDFDDLDYMSDIENVKMTDVVVTLQNGSLLSYNEAIEIFKKSVSEEKQQKLFNDGILERVDEHLDETIQKCRNDYEKISIMQRVVTFSNNMAFCTEGDIKFAFPQFSGASMDRFGYHYAEMVERYESKFGQVATEKQINFRISRMSSGDIVENLTRNDTNQIDMYMQQLDFINRNMEAITRLMIADATREINPNLDNLSKKRYTEQLLIGESFEDLSLMAQKWQEVSEKVESLQVDEEFKKKLNDSLDMLKASVVFVAGESIKKYFDDNKVLSNVSDHGEKAIEFISKVSTCVDSLLDKTKVKDLLGSSYLENFIMDPDIVEFCNRNYNLIANEKVGKINDDLYKKKSFVDMIKSKKEQQEQNIQVMTH